MDNLKQFKKLKRLRGTLFLICTAMYTVFKIYHLSHLTYIHGYKLDYNIRLHVKGYKYPSEKL